MNEIQDGRADEGFTRGVKDYPLSQMSDTDFIARLRGGVGHRLWSIKELVELENRGMYILENDHYLRKAITEAQEAAVANLQGLMDKTFRVSDRAILQQVGQLSSRIADVSLAFPKIEIPKLPEISTPVAFPQSHLRENLHVSFPPRSSPTLGMQAEQLQALREIPKAARKAMSIVLLEGKAQDRKKILNHCLVTLSQIEHETASQGRIAITTFENGTYQAAQSHAAGIATSLLDHLYGKEKNQAVDESVGTDIMGLPISLMRQSLVLRPLVNALTPWYPKGGDPVPDGFSRHATAHAIGRIGVFTEEKALIAIMLAVSLIYHFRRKLPG